MARPIEPTPVLYGKDAIRFEEAIAQPKHISAKEREIKNKDWELFKSRATFQI
jgi:hypothetical protein